MLNNNLILEEINSLRTNPNGYADKILKYKGYFDKEYLKIPDGKKFITQEGVSAYDEAEQFLRSSSPVCALTASKGLTKISEDLLGIVQNCNVESINSNVNMKSIIKKYGKFEGSFGRLMEFGAETAEQVVINLIVSDGDKSRSQRNQLFDNKFKFVGLAAGDHPDFIKCTMITLATKFKYNADINDVENY